LKEITLGEALGSFSSALDAVAETISTVHFRGYNLSSANYRPIYLRRTRKLRQAFFALKTVSPARANVTIGNIENCLQTIFDLKSSLESKKTKVEKCKTFARQFEKIRDRQSEILLDTNPYAAFKQIESIIMSCKKDLSILDPWIDEKIFDLYLTGLPPKLTIRVLTKHARGKFIEVARLFKAGSPNFWVRAIDGIHDRHLIVDERAWVLGQSLKDAGRSAPMSVVELQNVESAKTLFDELWEVAIPLV